MALMAQMQKILPGFSLSLELEQDECRNGVEENSTPGRTLGDIWGIESLNPAQYGLILVYDEVTMTHQCSRLRYG